ncbi:MAG: DUF502 domain-containing protein [Planctomycetota bacterium]|nr:DUF502 domain-containing protein [Planctomycetota bacterium]
MAEKNKKRGRISRAFLTGLATLLPTILTILILVIAYNFINEKIANPLTNLMRKGLSSEVMKENFWQGMVGLPDWQLDEVDFSEVPEFSDDILFSQRVADLTPPWLGFVMAIFLVLLVGIVFRGVLGRQLLRIIEALIQRIPLIKVIYPYAKQVTEFFFEKKNKIEYETAVAVEYPRKGLWSLGFVTSSGFRDIVKVAGQDVVAVFIPSSPTPITGYTILVPRVEIIPLDLSVEEVLRFTISGGVILPPNQVPLEPDSEEPSEIDSGSE